MTHPSANGLLRKGTCRRLKCITFHNVRHEMINGGIPQKCHISMVILGQEGTCVKAFSLAIFWGCIGFASIFKCTPKGRPKLVGRRLDRVFEKAAFAWPTSPSRY